MKIALWSAQFFKFVYFTCRSHVTGAASQSNCFISGMCGPPGFPFFVYFSANGAKKCGPPGFPLIQKTGGPLVFLMPYLADLLPFRVIFERML